jgi:hypothetical protein
MGLHENGLKPECVGHGPRDACGLWAWGSLGPLDVLSLLVGLLLSCLCWTTKLGCFSWWALYVGPNIIVGLSLPFVLKKNIYWAFVAFGLLLNKPKPISKSCSVAAAVRRRLQHRTSHRC